ncbi:MAG: hypothetical protein CMJ64_11990 [Planctomycetaceae bacterium]|nr:hypothetical protein [Planctomycetaceae bacterium]
MSRAEQRQFGRRRLRLETLENRRVLAGDVFVQNIIDPEDVNSDGRATAIDALILINELNGEGGSDSAPRMSADVNGDGVVSPGDALYVINRVNAGAETSGVPISARIDSLQKVLAAGKLPNGFTLDAANEILATLRNGGRPELGDRFRNGKMINPADLAEQLAGTAANAEASEPTSVPMSNAATAEPSGVDTESAAMEEPLDLLSALDEDASGAVDWWHDLVDDLSQSEDDVHKDYIRPWLLDGLREARDDDALREWLDRDRIDHWITALESNESMPQDILLELEAYRITLGDLQDQIAQMFANFDVEAIMEYLPDFEIIVDAITPEYTDTEYEAAIAEFVTGQLFSLSF